MNRDRTLGSFLGSGGGTRTHNRQINAAATGEQDGQDHDRELPGIDPDLPVLVHGIRIAAPVEGHL
jgi:hypothetical protein